jgi:hypothetical protein
MLKTRVTEQYGLKVPFINAGMAFIAATPLVRSVRPLRIRPRAPHDFIDSCPVDEKASRGCLAQDPFERELR